MAKQEKSKSGRRTRPLYFSAKISDYQFRKVLWNFTLDHSAAETARHVKLSANSISAIFAKLRRFFFEHRLFTDPYKGADPRDGLPHEGYEDIEHLILTYHLKRVAKKHGALDCRMDEPDYHFAESNWRFNFHELKKQRGPELVQRMMYAYLLEFVRRFGPVGARNPPTLAVKRDGLLLALDQFDRMIVWLERNSGKFRSLDKRKNLRDLRS